MTIKAVTHRVHVLPVSLEEFDETYAMAKRMGLEIPKVKENQTDRYQVDQGTVVAIGPYAFKTLGYDESPIKVGDMVSYARHSGKRIKDPYDDASDEIMILNDEDVVCIFSKE
jgi:co-chaperonin GroES (HSP10)